MSSMTTMLNVARLRSRVMTRAHTLLSNHERAFWIGSSSDTFSI